MSAESPHNGAATTDSEAFPTQKDGPVQLVDEQITLAPSRATSGAKGLLAYAGIGLFLMVTGALLGWRSHCVCIPCHTQSAAVSDCRYCYD